MGAIWNNLLYIPLVNLLVGLYQFLPGKNLGLTIVIFTILTRLVLWPLSRKNRLYRESMQKIQPELDKLKKKHEKDKEKLYSETMKLYSKYKVNPATGCLPLLIQLPFTLALYQALRQGLDVESVDKINSLLYAFVPRLEQFRTGFLWFDLTAPDPFYILPVLVAGLQYFQAKMAMSGMSGEAAAAAKQTMIYMPLILLFVTLRLPSGLTLYILLTTVSGLIENKGLRNLLKPGTKQSVQDSSISK